MSRYVTNFLSVVIAVGLMTSTTGAIDFPSDFGIYDDRPLPRANINHGRPLPKRLNTPVLISLDEALMLSKATGQKVLMITGAEWCGYCVKLKGDIQSEPLASLLDPYIVVYLDLDFNPEIKVKYDVRSYPTSFMLDNSGRVISTQVGYSPANYRLWLLKNKLRK